MPKLGFIGDNLWAYRKTPEVRVLKTMMINVFDTLFESVFIRLFILLIKEE